MLPSSIVTGRAVEVLHDRGSTVSSGASRWTGGSGYHIGRRLVLTAGHCVDYRLDLGDDERVLVRSVEGRELPARVLLVSDQSSHIDLALLETSGPGLDEHVPLVTFTRVNRDSPVPVSGCWAVGFPRLAESGPVLPAGSEKETWQVGGEILPGAKRRAGLLSLLVTSSPRPLPDSVAGSPWEGMSGAVVFATDPVWGYHLVGVISMHHRTEGESALTVVPITAVDGLPAAEQWWNHLSVPDSGALLILPRQQSTAAAQQRSRLTGDRAMQEHWDPRSRGVERAARPGWFFTGRHQALSHLVTWLAAPFDPPDNVRVVTGGPGSGKSAILARLITLADVHYRARMAVPIAPGDPAAYLPPGVIDVAVHARTAPTDEVISAIAAAANASQEDLTGLIERLFERRKPFTVAVDALDEADDPPKLAIALRRLTVEGADAGIRLIVATRPGPYRRLITALGLSASLDDPALIDLDTARYLSRSDLAEYVRRRLLLSDIPLVPDQKDTPYRGHEVLAGQVADAVARAAHPAFLIGQLVSRALLQHKEPITPRDPGWQAFPTTVAAAMDQYLASVGDQTVQERVEDLLRPLAYARGDGLPFDSAGLWPQLATALASPGRSYKLKDVNKLLDTAADYLIETVITGQAVYYRLYHLALSERLHERYQQHPRPFSVQYTIYHCLLGSITSNPDGTRNWLDAHPYLHSQLAGYAADADALTALLNDPGFLVTADPTELFGALQRHSQPQSGNTQIYRYAYPFLRRGADAVGERASYLQLAARRYQAPLADQLDQLSVSMPWTARWACGQRPHPHYTVGSHEGVVETVAVTVRHDRPVIVSGGDDRTVRVWDLETGSPVLEPLTGHNDTVTAVAVGQRHGQPVIVSGGDDGTVRVWDLETGSPVLEPLTGHDDTVTAVAVGQRHGQPVIVSGGFDATVRVWDLETGSPVLEPLTGHDDAVTAVAVGQRHGQPVIVSASFDEQLRVWDMETGDLVLEPLTGHDDTVTAVAVGQRHGQPVIVSAGDDKDEKVRVWDLESGAQVFGPLSGHHGTINAVTAGEQRRGHSIVVSGGDDQTIRVWDFQSGEQVLDPLTGHDGTVTAVAVSERHGRPVIVSGSADRTVRVWDLDPQRRSLTPLTRHSGGVNAVTVGNRNDRSIVVSGGYDHTVRVWDLESGDPVLGPLIGSAGAIQTVAIGYRHDQKVIVSSGDDHTIRMWDLQSGELVMKPLTGHDGPVYTMAVGQHSDRSVIVSGSHDGTLRIWDLNSGNQLLSPIVSHDSIYAVAIGQRRGRPVIVSGGYDRALRIWDLESGDPILGPMVGHKDAVQSVAIGQRYGQQIIVSGSRDETLRVWDLESGDLVADPLAGHGTIYTVAIGEREGRPVIVAGSIESRTVQIWDMDTDRPTALRIALQHQPMSVACTVNKLVIGTTGELLQLDLL
jgi:WD40 repeat protein